jgi:hypothetical protein
MAYDFSDWFPPTALSVSIASGDTTIQVDTLTSEFVNEVQAGGRFPLRIGRGTAAERVVVTAIADAANNKLSVERGVDGFSATSHNGGARVAHALPSAAAQETVAAPLDRAALDAEIQVLRSALEAFEQQEVRRSGDGSKKTFTISHSLGETPKNIMFEPETGDASGDVWVSNKTASDVELSFGSSPSNGTDNLKWNLLLIA